jgi:hypothetical protein
MNWIALVVSMACDAGSSPAPAAPAPPVEAAKVPTAPAAPSVKTCPDGSAATVAEVRMGSAVLTTQACKSDGEARLVSAGLAGNEWRWTPGEDETDHTFTWIGAGKRGLGHMVLRYWACPMDGCERATFFELSPDGAVRQLGEPTTAHAWAVTGGRLTIKDKPGFSPGYSIASATQTLAWNGKDFAPEGAPTATAEYDSWICEDTAVPVVDPKSGKPTGATVAVAQGDPIAVLQAGQPLGALFEYRVKGQTFWASGWEQNCAG